ncbi:hypothetical protein [Nonomuraea sp. C10]|nr:hypothetical protein [Nonomuraea sp. C10]
MPKHPAVNSADPQSITCSPALAALAGSPYFAMTSSVSIRRGPYAH